VLKALKLPPLTGNTPGNKVLKAGKPNIKGEFGPHLLTSGISNLFEGITICYPSSTKDLTVLAISSDNNPVIAVKEPGQQNKTAGRIVIDCAFTKLYCSWDTAGTARYVRNMAIWLLGIDHRMAIKAPLVGPLYQ
jgi:hypothetical protein